MAGPSRSAPVSIPLMPSKSDSSTLSSASNQEKHVRFDVPRQSGESRDGDSDLDLDAEIAALDNNVEESQSLLPFSLPWRTESTSFTSSTSSSQSYGYGYFKPNRMHRTHNHRKPLLVSFAVICAVLGSLVIAYLVIDEFLPEWPEGTSWFSSAQMPAGDYDYDGDWDAGSSWLDSISSGGGNGTSASLAIPLPFDSTNVLVPPHDLPPAPPLLLPLQDRLPYPILEEFYTTGLLPASLDTSNAPQQHPLDLVYLWVNATSPYLQQELNDRAAAEGVNARVRGKKRHWRDNGELRGAVRSAIKALRGKAGKVHVLSADPTVRAEDEEALGIRFVETPSGEEGSLENREEARSTSGQWRLGQIPKWLDWSRQGPEEKLKWHFHSDIFRLPADHGKVHISTGSKDWDFKNEEQWRDVAMPNFNSFGIESRIGWIEGLSENFIACNDDMFMMRELSRSDFRNPLLGNMVRMDPGLLVEPFMKPSQLSDSGEWGGLQHANQLLSNRFPVRRRMYMHHMPKAQAKALVHEANVMWAKDLTLATTRGFRESTRGEGDVEMAWLITHLRMERWREALLWSWVVGKIGGVDGVWGEDARAEVKAVLNMTQQEGDDKLFVELSRGERKTLEDLDGLMEQAGWEGPKATTYQWSSMDGHLPSRPDQPYLVANGLCTFNLAICLAPDFFSKPRKSLSASDIFTNIAFSQPGCGDCLINALVRASGERGIDAFLPTKQQVFYPKADKKRKMWERSEPMLPLVGAWHDGDFSVAANVRPGQDTWAGAEAREDGGVELRRWCIKLLSRYNYVFARTPSRFAQIKIASQLRNELKSIDASEDIAMVCINDDQSDRANNDAAEKFGEWMENHWGGKIEGVDWEKEGVAWTVAKAGPAGRAGTTGPTGREETLRKEKRDKSRWVAKNNDRGVKKYGHREGGRTMIWPRT